MGKQESFRRTEKLFRELVSVATWASMLSDQIGVVSAQLQREDLDFDRFFYTTPPERETSADMKEFKREKRAQIPPEFRYVVEQLDRYNEFQDAWHTHMTEASHLADEAAAELDAKNAPALHRTSTAIKRTIQGLRMSYPEHFVGDLRQVGEEWWVPTMRRYRDEVDIWINELRLLVIPGPRQATSKQNATSYVRSRTNGPEPKDLTPEDLDNIDLAILRVFMQARAFEMSKNIKLDAALRLGFTDAVRSNQDRGRDLKKAGFLDAQGGPNGGYWMTAKGQGCLRARGQWREPGPPQKAESVQSLQIPTADRHRTDSRPPGP